MATTTLEFTNALYSTQETPLYDGVVQLKADGVYATGALLYGGRAVLTAAHFVEGDFENIDLHFKTRNEIFTLTSTHTSIFPYYDPLSGNGDLALVWLDEAAPQELPRYNLYRQSDEIGSAFTFVGYGRVGSGEEGVMPQQPDSNRLSVMNSFDATAYALKMELGDLMGWSPLKDALLVADFDSGYEAHDALGIFLQQEDLGLGAAEGLIAQGDSGGPAFIDGKIAGVASYISSLSTATSAPDYDQQNNSSFGEIGFWHRVSYYQEWIDTSLRENYEDAPLSPAEVQKTIFVSQEESEIAYFMVNFYGVRAHKDQILSVEYSTFDGSAKAWEDYIPANGTLLLYPQEDQVLIPVEVLPSAEFAEEKIFYLKIYEPYGAGFEDDALELVAQRVLVYDDGYSTH